VFEQSYGYAFRRCFHLCASRATCALGYKLECVRTRVHTKAYTRDCLIGYILDYILERVLACIIDRVRASVSYWAAIHDTSGEAIFLAFSVSRAVVCELHSFLLNADRQSRRTPDLNLT